MIIHTRKRKKKKKRTKEQIGGYGTGAVRIRVLPDGTQIRVNVFTVAREQPKYIIQSMFILTGLSPMIY